MTHALILPPAPPRPTRRSLDSDTWDEIAAAYLAGATAPELARRYGTSIGSLMRHMKLRGATKRGAKASAFARAHAVASMLEDDARRRHRIAAEDLTDLAERDPHDPAVLAQVATTASGNAMVAQRFGEARALADLALQYGRAAAQQPMSFRMLVLRTAFDPAWADVYFGDGIDGRCEMPVKQDYCKRRSLQRDEDQRRARRLEHAEARVKRLEGMLRELGVEV